MAGAQKDGTVAGGGSDSLLLLDLFRSPYAQRVRIALAEKGLAYERAEQDIAAKSDLLLRSNPAYAKVPVLLHAGRAVCESLVIVQYLDEAWPSAPPLLLHADPYARARAQFWAEYADLVHLCGKRLWARAAADGEKGEEHEAARAEMVGVLRTLDTELGAREFFGGEAFGYVDVAVVPFTAWFLTYERYGGFSVEEECPRLAAWARRCTARESVAGNMYEPEKVYELVGLYKQQVLGQR